MTVLCTLCTHAPAVDVHSVYARRLLRLLLLLLLLRLPALSHVCVCMGIHYFTQCHGVFYLTLIIDSTARYVRRSVTVQ